MSPAPQLPTTDQVRTLPSFFERTVTADAIDQNGHMNISVYFREAASALWMRLDELGMNADYIPVREMSFFTVEHSIRYLGELRLDQPYAIHTGVVGRTSKAVHAVSFVVDRAHDRLACVMELMYVHVSMHTRRASDIPEDIAAALDGESAAHPWVTELDTRLSLRR